MSAATPPAPRRWTPPPATGVVAGGLPPLGLAPTGQAPGVVPVGAHPRPLTGLPSGVRRPTTPVDELGDGARSLTVAAVASGVATVLGAFGLLGQLLSLGLGASNLVVEADPLREWLGGRAAVVGLGTLSLTVGLSLQAWWLSRATACVPERRREGRSPRAAYTLVWGWAGCGVAITLVMALLFDAGTDLITFLVAFAVLSLITGAVLVRGALVVSRVAGDVAYELGGELAPGALMRRSVVVAAWTYAVQLTFNALLAPAVGTAGQGVLLLLTTLVLAGCVLVWSGAFLVTTVTATQGVQRRLEAAAAEIGAREVAGALHVRPARR